MMSRHSIEDDECLAVTGMTVQEYERFMCGCPACKPHVASCEDSLCVQCRFDWFASWREGVS